MSKGHKDFKSKHGRSSSGYKDEPTKQGRAEEMVEKRLSVFERLGTKGTQSGSKSRKVSSPERVSSKDRGRKTNKRQDTKCVRKSSSSASARKRRERTRSSDSSSIDRSSSSSQTTSTTESSTSSSATLATTTTSSSSVPSVKIRRRNYVESSQQEKNRPEHKRFARRDEDSERGFERSRSPRSRSGSVKAVKRKAPPVDDWKSKGRSYEATPSAPRDVRHSSPRQLLSPGDTYQKGRGSGGRNTEQERIRIVPHSYGTARPLPLDLPPRYSNPKTGTRATGNRHYQDFRSGRDEPPQIERLAPARIIPSRTDRIPPLLPESELRRHHDSHRGYGFHRPPPQPLLPERRSLPLLSPPLKLHVPKVDESIKSRVAEWVGGTVSSPKKLKVETVAVVIPVSTPKVIPDEEALSEISDFEDPPHSSSSSEPSDKEDLEVTSTLVEETAKTPEATNQSKGQGNTGRDSPREDSLLECMDFEAISEDEFDDTAGAKLGIVDALGVDWSILLRGKEPASTGGTEIKTRRRESSVVEVLKRTGLHRSLVTDELFTKVLTRLGEIETQAGIPQTKPEELEKPWLRRRRQFLEDLTLSSSGSRALSSRQDLAIRYQLLGFESPLESFGSKVTTMPTQLKNVPQ